MTWWPSITDNYQFALVLTWPLGYTSCSSGQVLCLACMMVCAYVHKSIVAQCRFLVYTVYVDWGEMRSTPWFGKISLPQRSIQGVCGREIVILCDHVYRATLIDGRGKEVLMPSLLVVDITARSDCKRPGGCAFPDCSSHSSTQLADCGAHWLSHTPSHIEIIDLRA